MVLPEYGSGCISDIVPALLRSESTTNLPIEIDPDAPKVLLVLDGLGYLQLKERAELAPTLSGLSGGSITSVAPSTTSTALTSITTGLTPGEHGLVGYRFAIDGHILNALRWSDVDGVDLRNKVPPETVQPFDPFMGESIAYVTRSEFENSGFTKAGWRGSRLVGYRTIGTLFSHVTRLLSEGEQLVYAYYEGIDKVSHEYGLGEVFDAEVVATDRLVADLIEALPSGTQLIITADHGQVDCRDSAIEIDVSLTRLCDKLSGEGRFRWLHSKDGSKTELLQGAIELYSDSSWVKPLEEIVDEGWFGPTVTAEAKGRLGDVALVPFEPIAFDDPNDTGIFELVGRHGSLTAAEMLVPCLTVVIE